MNKPWFYIIATIAAVVMLLSILAESERVDERTTLQGYAAESLTEALTYGVHIYAELEN